MRIEVFKTVSAAVGKSGQGLSNIGQALGCQRLFLFT